jgi:hypothetical protein
MLKASPRRAATAAAIVSALCWSSCQPGGATVVATTDPAPPALLSLQLYEPAAEQRLAATANVRIVFAAADPLATAIVRLLADADGDPDTVDDQFELARVTADARGATETIEVPLAGALPPGSYAIVGTIGDGDRAAATAKAPARILVEPAGPGDPPVEPVLSLELLEPTQAITVSRGSTLTLALRASGPAGTADVRLFTDGDGDVGTTADQHELASLPVPLDASHRPVSVPLAGAPIGLHHLMATATTGSGQQKTATAPGTVQIDDVAFATREGNSTYEEGRAIAALPDGSTIVVGRFGGSTTFGAWPAVHHLNSLGDDDIFLCRHLPNGSLAWARRAGGPSRGDWANAVAAGSDGSFVVGGYFHGLAGLDGGSITTGLQSAGDDDAFLARYAENGTMLWARRAGGIFHDAVNGVAMLPDRSSIATGSFTAQAIFGEANTATTLLVQGSLLTSDGFVARYDGEGALVWVRQFGGAAGNDAGRGVAVAADGSCVVTGVFRGVATFGSGTNQVTLLAAGGTDVFVARYDGSGSLLWARRGGGADDDEARGITICADGSCVAVGGFRGAASFTDPLQPVAVQALGGLDAYAAKYAADGTLQSVRTAGSIHDDEARSVTATADGGCLVTGQFQTAASFSGSLLPQNLIGFGARDVFVARYDAGHGLRWAKAAGGTDHDQVLGVTALADGSFAVTGVFHGTTAFGEGARRRLLNAYGWGDVFVVRYNADGDL